MNDGVAVSKQGTQLPEATLSNLACMPQSLEGTMKTRITELFGIQHPILLPGMSWVAEPELVAAVSNAGGLGILACGHLLPEETRAAIEKVKSLTDKPFGAGLTLLYPTARQNAEVVVEYKIPVVNYSLGKGEWLSEKVHAYGGKVIATVINEKHAMAAQKAGADALLVTGHEAAAHGGAVTSLVLIPELASKMNIPVVATGGFGDGRGLIAALSLGAEAIAMGTRFAASQESPVHGMTKEAIMSKQSAETIYTDRFDGINCRVMKSPGSEKNIKMGESLPKDQLAGHAMNAFKSLMMALKEGNLEDGVHLSGQVQGLINDCPSCEEIISRVMNEAEAGIRRLVTISE